MQADPFEFGAGEPDSEEQLFKAGWTVDEVDVNELLAEAGRTWEVLQRDLEAMRRGRRG
jgi:hypothetical protein